MFYINAILLIVDVCVFVCVPARFFYCHIRLARITTQLQLNHLHFSFIPMAACALYDKYTHRRVRALFTYICFPYARLTCITCNQFGFPHHVCDGSARRTAEWQRKKANLARVNDDGSKRVESNFLYIGVLSPCLDLRVSVRSILRAPRR